jgi:[acyl-carrier-protein] S-malonyltransferase
MRPCSPPHVLIFPGQGLQRIGMGRAACRASRSARAVYDRASEILGWDVRSLCTDGPAARLDAIRYAQVALHVTNMAVAASLAERGMAPVAVTGHSVGEVSALAAGGALDGDETLQLVDERARLMATVDVDGAMMGVVGLAAPVVTALCERLRRPGGLLCVAADNGPRHVVVSGTPTELGLLTDHLAGRRGVRTARVRAGGPFHSAAYAAIRPAWTEAVASLAISTPHTPFVSSVTGDVVESPDRIRETLIAQPTGMVRWREAVERLPDLGARCVVEAAEQLGVARLARVTLGRRMSSYRAGVDAGADPSGGR